MPISAAGNNGLAFPLIASASPRREGGFTLVELMIVVTVIALASAAVVFALPDPRGRLADEALRFAGRVRAAHDMAIVDGKPVSVWVSDGGYGFDARSNGQWYPLGDKPLTVEQWKKGTRPMLGNPKGRDRLVFDSTGLADRALDLRLKREGAQTVVRIGIDGSVRVDG